MWKKAVGIPLIPLGFILMTTLFWNPVKHDMVPYFAFKSSRPFVSVMLGSPRTREVKLSDDPRIVDRKYQEGEEDAYLNLKKSVSLEHLLASVAQEGKIDRRRWISKESFLYVEHVAITSEQGWLVNIKKITFPPRSWLEEWLFDWETKYISQYDLYVYRPVDEASKVWVAGLILFIMGACFFFADRWVRSQTEYEKDRRQKSDGKRTIRERRAY